MLYYDVKRRQHSNAISETGARIVNISLDRSVWPVASGHIRTARAGLLDLVPIYITELYPVVYDPLEPTALALY